LTATTEYFPFAELELRPCLVLYPVLRMDSSP